MEKLSTFITLIACFAILSACGGVDSDAKKAAKLTQKSIEQSAALELGKAEKSYKAAQKIMQKYDDHRKAQKFQELYRKYRDEGKTINLTKEP